MKFSSISNIGKIREDNQDCFGEFLYNDFKFFIVADGMGGYKGGDIASKLAVDSFISYIKDNITDKVNISDLLKESIEFANQRIYKTAVEDENLKNMGTTVVCLCIDYLRGVYHFGHVGDSRAYLYTNQNLKQITKDHSLVNDLLESGSITEEEADTFVNRSTITRVVGVNTSVKVDLISLDFNPGDIILLLTDGITNELSNPEIKSIIEQNEKSKDISNNLVDLALKKGGHDNITVTTIVV